MDSFRLEVPVTVRFRDIDSMGHINNAVYFTYCEVARNAYWTSLFGTRRLAEANFIVARAEMDYRSQADQEDNVAVCIRVSQIGHTSFEFHYNIIDSATRRLIGESRSVQVAFDYAANHKVPLPDAVRARILEFEGPENVLLKPVARA